MAYFDRFQFSVFLANLVVQGLTVTQTIYKLRQDLGPQDLTNILVATGNGKIGSVGVKFVLDRRDDLVGLRKGF